MRRTTHVVVAVLAAAVLACNSGAPDPNIANQKEPEEPAAKLYGPTLVVVDAFVAAFEAAKALGDGPATRCEGLEAGPVVTFDGYFVTAIQGARRIDIVEPIMKPLRHASAVQVGNFAQERRQSRGKPPRHWPYLPDFEIAALEHALAAKYIAYLRVDKFERTELGVDTPAEGGGLNIHKLGSMQGRLVIASAADGTILCSAPVQAQGSPAQTYTRYVDRDGRPAAGYSGGARQAVDADLTSQIRAAMQRTAASIAPGLELFPEVPKKE